MYNISEIYFTNQSYYLPLAINYCNSTLKSKDLILTLHNIYYITNQKQGYGGFKKRIQDEKRRGGNRVRKFISLSQWIPYLIKKSKSILPVRKVVLNLKKQAFIFWGYFLKNGSKVDLQPKFGVKGNSKKTP